MPIMENICASYVKHFFVSVMGNISANYWELSRQLWGTFKPVMGNICAMGSKFIFLMYTTNILA